MRGLQYSHLAKITRGRLFANAIAAMLVISLFATEVSFIILGVWALALAAALYHSAKIDSDLADADHRKMGSKEWRQQAGALMVVALIWAVPMALFPTETPMVTHLGLWAALSMMAAGTALWLARVPITTLVFAGINGLVSMAVLAVDGAYAMAAI
ncbi:MAG: hypothetical protein AB7U34_05490, partial [Novosphingobium sp.]